MLTLQEIAFDCYRQTSEAASTSFQSRRARVIREWNEAPLEERGILCWLYGSNYERDRANPDLGIATEVHHRYMSAVVLALNDPEYLAWGGYEEEEAVENIRFDIMGNLTKVIRRHRDKYLEAAELGERLRIQRERNAARRVEAVAKISCGCGRVHYLTHFSDGSVESTDEVDEE